MARAASAVPTSTSESESIAWPQQQSPARETAERGPLEVGYVLDRCRTAFQQSVAIARIRVSKASSMPVAALRYAANERPLYLVAGVAAAAFLVGVALRLRRSRND
jgi:hypothetical protein